jgi:VanZ family protein
MLKRIKTLLKDNIFIIALAITFSIVCLSLLKIPKTKITITNIDKVYHSIAYFTLTISWLIVYYKKPQKKNIIVICSIIFGIIIELLQSTLTNYRTGEYLDVIANSSGVILALLIFNLISKKKID